MMRLMNTLIAVAVLAPASMAFAQDEESEAGKKNGEATTEAGKRSGDMAPQPAGTTHQKYATPDQPDLKHARLAIRELNRADAGLAKFFNGSAGYVVFATVGKGAVGVGGAHGTGVLFEHGMAIGAASLNQVTVGLQLGGQAYTEVIFFETEKAMADFKRGAFNLAAQVSAVVAAEGASANARYVEGVSVFTLAKSGVMVEASVGGQKFGYLPFRESITLGSR